VKLYADRPGRMLRQLVTDLLVIVWVYAWVRLGMRLYDLVERLAAPGRKVESAGNGLAGNLSGAADKIDNVPGAGKALASPFRRAADAAQGLAAAGQEQQQVVHDLAAVLSLAVVAVPLALVLFGWLPLRLRWVRRAGAAASLRAGPAGRDLLALRALATQPLRQLTALDPEIAAAWRRGDPAAVESLAALELRRLGLRT
jgi:hypothetical protein